MNEHTFALLDFPSRRVNLGTLHAEFLASTLAGVFLYLQRIDDSVTAYFSTAVALADVQGVINAHSGATTPSRVITANVLIDGIPTVVEIPEIIG